MKSFIRASFVFSALFFALLLFFFACQPVLAQFSPQAAYNQVAVPANMSRDSDLAAVIIRFLIWAMYLIAFVAITAIVVSGFMFIFSGGENMATNARKILMYAILGLIIALLGWVILNTVASMLGIGAGWGGTWGGSYGYGGSGIGGGVSVGGSNWGINFGFGR